MLCRNVVNCFWASPRASPLAETMYQLRSRRTLRVSALYPVNSDNYSWYIALTTTFCRTSSVFSSPASRFISFTWSLLTYIQNDRLCSSEGVVQAGRDSPSLSSSPGFKMSLWLLYACVWSSQSSASMICQTSSTVCSKCSPQHVRKPLLFLSPDQQSGTHCQMICVIQLLTPNLFVWLKNNLFTRHYGALARCVSMPYKSTFCLLT